MALRKTQQKLRSQPERERARAKGGGLRDEPVEKPAGPSATTGGRTTRGLLRSGANPKSSKK